MLKDNLLMTWFARSANEVNNLGGQEVNHSAAESARLLVNSLMRIRSSPLSSI